jgi:ornithine--oxo-acid transaminase
MGRFLAAQHYDVEPDMVVLAKALSGGLVPCGAVLMTDRIYDSVYSSLKRAIVRTSTFSENNLAMRAGLATLDVLHRKHLGERAVALGNYLRQRLREALSGYEMVEEIRGIGLLNGIAFQSPRKLGLRVPFETFRNIRPAVFGQLVVMRLFHDHGILTQICGNNFMVPESRSAPDRRRAAGGNICACRQRRGGPDAHLRILLDGGAASDAQGREHLT